MLFHETLERLADKVKKTTNGRLVFEVYPVGALVPPFEGIKAVSDGAYQAQFSYSAMWVRKIPVAPLFTAWPGGEIMPNLQRGVLDGAEYSIPAFDKTLGIWEVCKYVMTPGIHQPASQTGLLINKKAYAALPDDLKDALKATVAYSNASSVPAICANLAKPTVHKASLV